MDVDTGKWYVCRFETQHKIFIIFYNSFILDLNFREKNLVNLDYDMLKPEINTFYIFRLN